MSNLKMFTFCLHSRHLKKIEALNYVPVGLGNNDFPPSCLRDNTGDNISNKNKYYSELTFHYWFWKNMIDEIEDDDWIGFSHYKYFWKNSQNQLEGQFEKNILNTIPDSWNKYEAILGEKILLENIKFLKILKNGGLSFLFDLRTYVKKKRNIEFHFEIFHGKNIIDNALQLLDNENKKDFKIYLSENNSYHKWNMFICKSKNKLKIYYKLLFDWLLRCEEKFGFELEGYGKVRIYGFLAERFMSYWFSKNMNYKEHPLFFHNLDQA